MVRQLVYTMFISNNRPSFHLSGNENSLKHRRVSKYHENDALITHNGNPGHFRITPFWLLELELKPYQANFQLFFSVFGTSFSILNYLLFFIIFWDFYSGHDHILSFCVFFLCKTWYLSRLLVNLFDNIWVLLV